MLFASDLDNTLIHSYKKSGKGDICVEWKDGKALSFMTNEVYHLLKKVVTKCDFVPVTTRSLEQYKRIDLGIVPQYAIVAHGAILLVDGQIDEEWTQETHKLIGTKLPTIEENSLLTDIRYVDDFFIFGKSENPNEAVSYLKSVLCDEKFMICAVHNKVYVIPKALRKSVAVKRLSERLHQNFVICSGDSELDVSMLEIANIAIHPQTLQLQNQYRIELNEKSFSDEMLKVVHKLIAENGSINNDFINFNLHDD